MANVNKSKFSSSNVVAPSALMLNQFNSFVSLHPSPHRATVRHRPAGRPRLPGHGVSGGRDAGREVDEGITADRPGAALRDEIAHAHALMMPILFTLTYF